MTITHLMMLVCAASIALYVRRYDRWEPEPGWMLALAVAGGFGMMWAAGRTEDALLQWMGPVGREVATRAAVVATVEEAGKLFALLVIAVAARSHLNDPLDGVIYGTMIGLGAAINESLLYLAVAPDSALALGAEVVRLFAHALLGGTLGFALGAAVDRRAGCRRPGGRIVLLGYLFAVVIHTAWNGYAYVQETADAQRHVLLALMAILMMMWGLMVSIASRHSAAMHAAPAPAAPS